MPIRVLIVDDHDLVRAGIRSLLSNSVDIEVIGESSSGENALQVAPDLRPDVVLMDIQMPNGMSGIEASNRLNNRFPSIKIIILTASNDVSMSKLLLKQQGVSGYLTKGSSSEEMFTAIKACYSGKKHISPEMAQKLAISSLDDQDSPFEKLSTREMDVLMKITSGKTNQEIAQELSLSPKTTSTYRTRLMEKLEVKNDVELTKLSLQHGLGQTSQ